MIWLEGRWEQGSRLSRGTAVVVGRGDAGIYRSAQSSGGSFEERRGPFPRAVDLSDGE